jgi:prepilin-type N-terminal cleavage/methylation domain-containing protein
MAPLLAKTRTGASGFSLPEVLVSSALLALIVASSAQLYIHSGSTIQKSSLRDAVNARIAEDLEELRRESWRWACEDGSEGGIPTACTGSMTDADKPVAYKTGRSIYSTFPELARYKQACGFGANSTRITQTTAALMQQERTLADGSLAFPTGPITLSWTKNLAANALAPAHTASVRIQRTIQVNSVDQNQLDVSYSTKPTSPVQVSLNASLTPQALSWCP